ITGVDAEHGWAVGEETLLATADGGESWRPAGEPPDPLVDVQFISADRGWGTTRSGTVAVTTDGGGHWASQNVPGRADTICFANPSQGWAAGQSRVMATSDAGRHWRLAYSLPSIETDQFATGHCKGNAVWILFRGSGAVSKQNYTLMRSDLGTGRWTVLAHNTGFAPESSLPGFTGDRGIGDYAGPFTVIDARVALLIGQCLACAPTTQSLVVANVDGPWAGGRIPALDGTEADFAISPTFVDRDHGWVVTTRMEDQRSLIAATSDGGRTWDLLPTPGP
ncbi:MAG TPA: hypothetical protein VG034_15640, partial [Acidimicrobiia bacterium]|nr:hypothetical protein [Acidimicrobiia bacterium]